VRGLSGGDEGLARALGEPRRQELPAIRIELAHHVVEEEERWVPPSFEERTALGE
jgi:hypothetical protein